MLLQIAASNELLRSQQESTFQLEEVLSKERYSSNQVAENTNNKMSVAFEQKHLSTDETSLLNSSYADFQDVYRNLQKKKQ